MAKLLLAPMEGLLDDVLREILTQVGGYDLAVSEFIRVSGNLLPLRAFRRVCPELDNGGRTSVGTPLVVQLLGSDPTLLAENAAQLASLAPAGIDLNFGCPAPTVNRHGGGAMLLGEPEKLFRICSAVRRAIPASLPLSAKMRLGISDTEKTLDCAHALAASGIVSLVVHARTKSDGYRPPAHWDWVARIRDAVTTPVVANGEVWTSDDHRHCCAISDCTDVMLGRGAVADPFLARRIREQVAGERPITNRSADWRELRPLLGVFWRRIGTNVHPAHAPGRLKLWLNALRRTFVEAETLFLAIRPLRRIDEVERVLHAHGVPIPHAASVPIRR